MHVLGGSLTGPLGTKTATAQKQCALGAPVADASCPWDHGCLVGLGGMTGVVIVWSVLIFCFPWEAFWVLEFTFLCRRQPRATGGDSFPAVRDSGISLSLSLIVCSCAAVILLYIVFGQDYM